MKLNLGVLDRRFRNVDRLLIRARGKEIHLDFLGQGFQLINRRRAIDVRRHHQHFFLFSLAQIARQLGNRGGFTRPLQAGHQHHRRGAFQSKPFVGFPHDRFKFLLNDLDELLARRQAFRHFLPDRTLAHPLDKGLDHRQGDIRLEKRLSHLSQGILDVVIGQAGLTLDRLQRLG
ncbi:hypothetical protein VRRI112168_14235 [Vreelandella rituensis]